MSETINSSRFSLGVQLMQKENGNSCVILNTEFAKEMLEGTGLKVGTTYRYHNKKGEAQKQIMTIEGVSHEYSGIDAGVEESPEAIQSYIDEMRQKPKQTTIWAKHNGKEEIGIVDYKGEFTLEEDGRIKYGIHGYLVEESNIISDDTSDVVLNTLVA